MTVVLLVLLPSVRGATPEEMFAAPPPEAHVGVWWHWMGGQVSREGVEKDIDWFVRMGITSATVFGMADCTMHMDRFLGDLKRHLGDDLPAAGLRHVLLDSYGAGWPTWQQPAVLTDLANACRTPHLRGDT